MKKDSILNFYNATTDSVINLTRVEIDNINQFAEQFDHQDVSQELRLRRCNAITPQKMVVFWWIKLFESFFLYGLTSFLVGHLCFLYAFVKQQGFQWPVIPGIFLGSIASTILFLCYDNLGALLLPVLVYIGVILIMSWQGIALQRQNKHFTFRYVGWAVVLFLFSDAVLALNKFYIPFAYSGVLILSTYWLAICLIALSASKATKEPV